MSCVYLYPTLCQNIERFFQKSSSTSFFSQIILVNLAGTAVQQDGLIFFPEFCRVVLRKFREEDEEQFAQVMFKVSSKLLTLNTFSIKSINARAGIR
jgi:hypothetical protein